MPLGVKIMMVGDSYELPKSFFQNAFSDLSFMMTIYEWNVGWTKEGELGEIRDFFLHEVKKRSKSRIWELSLFPDLHRHFFSSRFPGRGKISTNLLLNKSR